MSAAEGHALDRLQALQYLRLLAEERSPVLAATFRQEAERAAVALEASKRVSVSRAGGSETS